MSMARLFGRLRGDRSGLALIEFAYGLPVFLTLVMTGSELANYVTTKMRISQAALHLADHAARMGTGSQLSAKRVTEANVDDVLTGAGLQAGDLDLYTHGRVVMTNIEPMANPNTTDRYKVTWRRCRGAAAYPTNTYATANQTNMTGIGPAGRQVKSPNDNATIFVEVYYEYQPLIPAVALDPELLEIREIASMTVRDRRDLAGGVRTATGVTPSLCT